MDRLQIQPQILPELCKIVTKPKAANVVANLSSALRLGDVVAARMLEWAIIHSVMYNTSWHDCSSSSELRCITT